MYVAFYIITGGDFFDFDYENTNFTISDTVVRVPTDIVLFKSSSEYTDYVTIGNNILGDKGTQKQFVSDYLKMHNALIFTDVADKVVYTVPFETVKNNISQALNWTGKLDFIQNNSVEFNLGLAQINTLTYADDDTVIKPLGTDGSLLIDDENLPLQKDYLSLEYAASVNVERLDGESVSQLKVYTNGERSEDVVSRILLIRRNAGTIDFFDPRPSNNDSFTGDVPYTYFIDDLEQFNLGFANSLIPDYFGVLEGILNRTKVIECLLRLNTSDIATFDFLKPVYIKELDGYFYVSKIKFDYTSNASSVCELVKLL
jgi:hypothetical protein